MLFTILIITVILNPGAVFPQVLTPMLRCLGNIICSGLDETAAVACRKKSLFPALGQLLASEHQHIRKECIWVLSNITGRVILAEYYYYQLQCIMKVALWVLYSILLVLFFLGIVVLLILMVYNSTALLPTLTTTPI